MIIGYQAPGPEHIVRLLEDLLIFHCAFLVQWELAKASTLVLTLGAETIQSH
jgi:hypothetical protein